ncbi:hypothetical protein DFJ74DRAFT_416990 [Hyaloraphidium curvatum]|nr:hypothetical protein DFJ74DRAFT_416990 [Hyaloraphidium curvatum]
MLRVAATADLFENARVQLLAGKQSGGRFQGTLALALPGSFFTDLLELMMPGFAIPGLNLVASGSTLAFVASSRDLALDGPMVLDAPLDFLPSIKRGLSIGLQMGLPSDCGGSGFCDVMVSLLGRDVRLQIGAGISPPDIALSAAVSNLRISSGLTLTAVGFSASFPSTALFLSGSIALTVDADRDPLQLQARIGVKGASVVLGASMTGIWRSAFGWDRLSIGNIVLEVGITAALGAPSILVGGQVAIGRGCYGPDFSFLPDAPCIGGSIYVSFDPVNPQNNWFAGDMTQLDVKRIILAFTDVAPDPSIIPAPLLNSGFSGPTSISLCPGGNCAAPGRQYQQGFFLNGTLNILDVTARVQISVSMGRGIKLLVELDPVKLAGGLIEIYRSKQDTDRGPILNVALEYDRATELGLTLSAYVKVFMFQLETIVSITPTEYILSFSQKFFVFDVSFRFQAAIGSRSKFSVTGDFDMRSFQQFVDGVLEALGSWAKQGAAQLDSARREVESKRRAVDDARKSVCDWKDKCTEAAEKVSCGRRRVRRSELPLQEEALVPPQDPADLTDAERLEAIVLEKRWSAFTNAFRSVGNAASGAVNTVSDAARRAAEQAAAAVARARAEAERVAREQAARAAEAARIAREEMERRAREAAEAAQREAQRVKDLAEKQAREAAEAAKREAERVQQQAAEQARRAQEAMAAAQKAAQEQARRVQEAAAAAQQAAQEQARRAQEAMAAAAAAQAQRVRDALAAAAAAAQAEAQRVKDETERRAREMAEAARIAAENAARETERRAREAAEAAARFQEEARRRAIEAAQAAQREAQRIRDAAERAAREAQERLVAEAARARELAERAAREAAEAARREAERIRNELAAKVQAISNGACRGWNMVSGLVVNTACQSACTVAQGGLDIATVALQASEQGLAGISEGVKAAAKMADFLGDRVRSMISFSAAGFVGSVDADFNSKFMAGSVGIRIKGVFFGEKVDVDFTLDASDVGKAAREFFDRNVRGAAEKALTLLQLSKRDLADVDFVAPGHFRFRKRQLLDGLDTILFDSRDMTLDDGIELHREQIRRRLQMRGGALPEDFFDGLSDREVFGERISAYQLPVVPALTQGYDEGPAPGLAGGEDNDFRIRFGDRYVSCGTAVGAFSREGPACRLRKKVDATIFLSTAEPLGQSFRTSSGLCLAVNSRSSIVLTPCYSDLPNGVWRYDNATGQLSSLNAGVVAAPDGGSPIAAESIAIASAASDGKCMTATKAGKLRVTTCGVKGEASAAVMRGQAFRPRINAESINLGDLISFHSTGLVDREYIAVDLDSLSVGLFRGNLTVQQDDKRAAFKVLAPICGANYHFTFESVAKPGFFVAVDPDNRSKLIVTDKLRRKDDACFLPTPGPSRPIYAAGCPGLTFSLRSRSIRNSYVRANEDGNSLVLAGGRDPALMTCWRPVPPTGAPSAAHPVAEPQDEEGESGEGGADVFDADGLAEDVAEDEGNNLGLDDDS